MKMTIILSFIILTTTAFADQGVRFFKGYKYGHLNNAKVTNSAWLESAATLLEREHDFHENVSYVGEVWDEVANHCGFTEVESEQIYNDSEVYVETKWNKIINKKGKTKGYILYLFAHISSRSKECYFPRSVYVINTKGIEVNSDKLWTDFKIGFEDFLLSEEI